MYFIIENQLRPDGIINTSTVSRQGFAKAESYYHDRYSKMIVTDLYMSVSLLLVDENLNVIEHDILKTQYVEE